MERFPKKKRRKRKWQRRLRDLTRPLRYALEIAAFRLLLIITRRLSHERALAWGRSLGRTLHRLARHERHTLQLNLDQAFGDRLPADRRTAIERGVFESLGMLAFEAGHSTTWDAETFKARVAMEGSEHWKEALAAGRGAIMVTGHYGNWELMPAAFLCHTGIGAGIVSRDVTNPALNRRISAMRGRMGNPVFSNEGNTVGILRLLRRGGVLAMVADQDSERIRCEPVDFFGHPAGTPIGPGFLARKCGAPVVPVYLQRHPDDSMRHTLRFFPPVYPDASLKEEDDAQRIMQQVNRRLESMIRETPEQWAWIHDRWRLAKIEKQEEKMRRKRERKRRRREKLRRKGKLP